MKYSELAELYEKLGSTTKRLEKTRFIADALQKAKDSDLEMVMLLLQGRVFPAWEKDKKLGFASNYMVKAIARVTGNSEKEIKKLWAGKGDLGLVAEQLCVKKQQQTLFSRELSLDKVFDNIKKLPAVEGEGSVDRKVGIVSELLSVASAVEAKYIVRTVLEILRVGIASGTIRDAIVWANFNDGLIDENYEIKDRERYNEVSELVQSAYDKTNDFAKVAKLAKKGEKALSEVKVIVGRPIKVMLAQLTHNVEEGFAKVGKPCAVEYKYDGFRMQINKTKDGKITLFTRRMEDVTPQFPEVVEYIGQLVDGEEFVIDGEAIGFDPKTKKYLPFQKVSQRIKRKYDIEDMAKQFPVEVNIFDVIYHDGKSYLKEPLKKRMELIKKIIKPQEQRLRPAHSMITDNVEEAQEFYDQALSDGMEGVMMKNLESPYKPGSRVGQWVKLKPTMETLDLVIVGAEWGEGKRSGWLTSFHLACRDELTGEMLTIGKVGTGIKELEGEGVTFEEMTELLKPFIIKEDGREVQVKPEIVIEVKFEEIQASPTYTSGYALRFPRLIRLRDDRGVDDVSTHEMVEQLYDFQKI